MTIAITGAAGQLGGAFCERLGSAAHPLNRPEFDLTSRESIERCLYTIQPDAIINCAAYTNVDQAEKNRDACFQVNADSVKILAEIAAELDIPLVQVSTDYVFGGDTGREAPYAENDVPSPQGAYGQSKLQGERNAAAWRKHFIVRTCGLYAKHPDSPVRGRNFVDTMLSLGQERETLNVVADQICGPTSIQDLCDAIDALLKSEAYGTYHVTNHGPTSWFRFAKKIFEVAGLSVQVTPITTAQFNAPAPRPAYSVLDCSKFEEVTGLKLPSWETAVESYIRQLGPLAKPSVATS